MANSVSLLSNSGENHKEFLLDLLTQADEIVFAVGFLKNSGFQNLKEEFKEFCSDKTKKSTFYIGTGLGETDSDALLGLFNILKTNSKHQLVLCTPEAGIFHPKIYVFRNEEKVTIITGSANLTQHGWAVNDEVSMITETTSDSTEHLQLMDYFKTLNKKYYSDDVEKIIKRYKKEKEEHQNKFGHVPTFKFRQRKTTIAGVDMPRLRRYYELYKKDKKQFIDPAEREDQYIKAKKNLEELASNKTLTSPQFSKLLGQLVGHKEYKPKLWHSGSIHRKTYRTLDYPDAFREIVRLAKQSTTQSIPSAFDMVISRLNQMRKAKEIYGVGENIVTEILLSFNPQKFANLNDNPITVLELVGKIFPTISSFKGEDYLEYVELLNRIKNDLGMATFLEIDSFFNFVYWNLIEE